jgi:Zn-dependent M28 family amino/carboxypeptidase
MNTKRFMIWLTIIISGAVLILLIFLFLSKEQALAEFNGQRAYSDVKYQVGLGPRTMGSVAHEQATSWIISELQKQNWQVNSQETVISGQTVKNIIAQRGVGTPWVIIASHYDSRSVTDKDPNPENRKQPVMGANDGASTVAILLEFARILPVKINKQIWLVFFDGEDNGTSSGSGWDLGSQYFVSELSGKPDRVVVLDMLGDKDLNIYMERNSDPELNTEIWDVANELGNAQFIPRYKYDLIDDHIPFIQAGLRAVDVIDFDYPYWHTTSDTLDKVSADSLKVVGDTILKWLEEYPKSSTPPK